MRALVVDDAQFVRRLIKGILISSCNFTSVEECKDGVEALVEINANHQRYDLLILDWNMPERNGLEVLKELRQKKIHVPVIMCTSESQRESIVEAITAGANDYVVKPFEAHTLVQKVKKIISLTQVKSRIINEKTALVVDDTAVVREIIKQALIEDGFVTNVILAENGFKALQLFPQYKFDIVILDWNMPNFNGLEVVKEIRKVNTVIPIVMVTSSAKVENVVVAFEAGISNFIAKPFEKSELSKKVRQVMIQK